MRELKILNFDNTYNNLERKEDIFKVVADKVRESQSIDILYWHPLEPITNPVHIPGQKDFDEYFGKILYEFESFLIDRDIKSYFLYGGEKLFDNWDKDGKYIAKNIKILTWKTSLLHYSLHYLEKSYNKKIGEININTDFEKLFFSLNRHPRGNRVLMLDNLYKNGLFDYGKISWNILSSNWHEKLNFQFWEEKIMILDMNDKIDKIDNIDQTFEFNTDFLLNTKCLFNVVAETLSNNHDVFISEKTFKNLLIKQPYLCVGPLYHNKMVESLGFKNYHNIFDYGFDNEMDMEKRIYDMVHNLNNHKDSQLTELYNLIVSDITYNKNRAIEICEKDEFLPIELIELYKENTNIFTSNKFILRDCDIERIFKNF